MTPLLQGLRILELGHYIAAPFATRVLADLGADVIKVEPPGTGDPVRYWGRQVEGGSIWWSLHGRNKRCVTADLKSEEGRQLVLGLIKSCEVVVENYRPGRLDRLGLRADVMAGARPGVTIVRISGYGQTGPQANLAGFGVIGEAKGGLRYLCAHEADVSELPPVRTGVSIGDSISGLYGALGALAAVIDQRATGRIEPRVLDVALGESVLSLLEGIVPEYSYDGTVRRPNGSRIPTASPSNTYKSSDGHWVLVAANSDALFKTMCEVIDRPELLDDPRFTDNPSRVNNNAALDDIIAAWVAARSADAAVDELEEVNIPVSKVYTVEDIVADDHFRARGMIADVDDPRIGRVLQPSVVPLVEGLDRNTQIRWPGPEVGAHNGEVYGELLGMSESDIVAFRQRGVL